MTTIKESKCLSILIREDEIIRIMKTGFSHPQTYYVIRETAYDHDCQERHISIMKEKELVNLLGFEDAHEVINLLNLKS